MNKKTHTITKSMRFPEPLWNDFKEIIEGQKNARGLVTLPVTQATIEAVQMWINKYASKK